MYSIIYFSTISLCTQLMIFFNYINLSRISPGGSDWRTCCGSIWPSCRGRTIHTWSHVILRWHTIPYKILSCVRSPSMRRWCVTQYVHIIRSWYSSTIHYDKKNDPYIFYGSCSYPIVPYINNIKHVSDLYYILSCKLPTALFLFDHHHHRSLFYNQCARHFRFESPFFFLRQEQLLESCIF